MVQGVPCCVDSRTYTHATKKQRCSERECHVVLCRPPPPKGRSGSTVDVFTRDGEVFPVKRKLLRSCIALTAAVRGEVASVAVDVDTLVFDRYIMRQVVTLQLYASDTA